MSKTHDLCDQRVDAFVAAVNSSPPEPFDENEIPRACIVPLSESSSGANWHIGRSVDAEWLQEVEARLPFRLPPHFPLIDR